MKDFSDYIENCLKDYPNDENTFRYKKNVFDSMTKRAAEIKKHGLNDENVVYDLVVDENPKIMDGYLKYLEKLKEKETVKKIPLRSAIYVGCLVLVFLFVGFVFNLWHPGWLIIEGGVSVLIIGLMLFAVSRMNKRKWYPFMRLLVAGSVMIAAQAVFLVLRIPFHIMQSYLIFLAAPAAMLIGDVILATCTKQRMVILNYLLCVPAVMAFVYAILGILHIIAWDPGWLLMIAAVLIDFGIILGIVQYNKKYTYKPEVEDAWK